MAINIKSRNANRAAFLQWQIDATCDGDRATKIAHGSAGFIPTSQQNRNFYTIEDMENKAAEILAELVRRG